MNNNKEQLTDATMKALNGNLGNYQSEKNDTKKKLKRLLEDYVSANNYTEIFNIIINIIFSTMDENQIADVLSEIA